MHRYLTLAAAAAMATTAATAGAQNVTAPNKPFSFGVMAGAAVPVGDLSNGTNTGYNVTGMLGLNTPELPINFRINVGYNNFGAKGGYSGDNVRVWEFSGNATYDFPTERSTVRPYFTGGLGMYNVGGRFAGFNTTSENRFGFNAGGGLIIPLTGMNAFIEARYTQVSANNGTSVKFVPITFGLAF